MNIIVLNLTYPGNVFSMSGGTLRIHQANSKGGVFINSDLTNVNITGGNVVFNIGNANDFVITSKAPFYHLEMTKSVSNSAVFRLDGGQSGTGGTEISLAGQDLRVLSDLIIRGKETDGSYPNIDFYAVTGTSNVNDVYIGGSFKIEAGAQYWTAADGNRLRNYDGVSHQPSVFNTTYFNQTIGTSAIDTLYWGNTGDQFDYNNNGDFVEAENMMELGNFVLNRTTGNALRMVSPGPGAGLRGNSSLTVDVNGDASVLSGTFDQGRLTVRIWGSITNYDRFGTYFSGGDYPVSGGTPNVAQIRFREDPPIVINTSENAVFGNIRFNVNPNHTIEFNSDVYIERMEFMRGSIYIKNHQLKVDDMWRLSLDLFEDVDGNTVNASTLKVTDSGRAGENIIYTNGKASDGGLALKITQNSLPENSNRIRNNISPITYPIGFTPDGGTTVFYRPAQINVQGLNVSDDGYVRIRPVSGELQTTELTGGEILQQYWRVSYSDFESIPDQMAYRFYYRNQSDVAGVDLPAGAANEADYVPGFVMDGGTFSRDYESTSLPGDVDDVFASSYDTDTRILVFNGTSSNGEFIHGSSYAGFEGINANYTAGMPARFIGAPAIFYNNRTGSGNWNNNSSWFMDEDQTIGATSTPSAGDIVVLRGSYFSHNITVNGTRAAAEIVFVREGTYVDIESLPRLRLLPGDVLTANKISGVGDIYLQRNMTNSSVLIADIGDFAANDTSLVHFYMTGDGTYDVNEEDFFSELPTLRIYGNHGTNRQVRFNYGLQMKNLIVDGGAELLVGGNYSVENRTRLGFTGDGRIEYPSGGTPYTLSTGEFVTGKGKTGSGNDFQVTVASGGGNAVEHVFEVRQNIHLGFTAFDKSSGELNLDFFTNAADNNVILRLAGDGAHSFINEYAVGSTNIDLYRIEMNKGADLASSFSLTPNFTLNGPTSGVGVPKAIQLNNGTLIFDNASYDFALTTGNDDFFIPATSALEVRQGRLTASGNSGILLDGRIILSGGTLDMSGGNNYIEYTASGNSRMDISSGELIVGSQIRRGLTSTEGSLKYSQTGGKVVVGTHAAPENNRGVFEILNDGSRFSFTGGELEISRAQMSPSFASIYLDPETSFLGNDATLKVGNAFTPASQTMGIYSNVSLPNVHINNESGNNPVVCQWAVPLSIGRLLQVDAGSVFDANGLDLFIRGDMAIDGSFVANGNTTWFNGTTDQQISGALTFYNLYKISATELELNDPQVVTRELHHNNGLLIDNGNDITVRGNLVLDGDHLWGNAGRGVVMEGAIQQTIGGSGSFGKLTINNANGVLLNNANNIVVENALQLEQGLLNIGSNLMTLSQNAVIIEENPFSATNMVTTNVSFTDNGIKKVFPAGAGSFVFPVGSAGKYTPVSFDISSNSTAGGSILVKPAGEYHPSVVDPDNVLQYHWVLRAEDISGFSAVARMKYDLSDIKGDIGAYWVARLLSDGSGEWNKTEGPGVIDQATQELLFNFYTTDDLGISGDYTAGLKDAIPDQVPTYISIGNGDWNDASIWDTYPVSGGSVPGGGPRGSMVIVSHEVHIPVNYISSYRTAIAENGILSVGETFGHRLGDVSGTGVLSLERGDLPAGFYADFTSAAGGTIRFGGNGNYDVLSTLPVINHLEFTDSGLRRLPNLSIQLLGDLTINGPVLRNEQNRKLSIKGDVAFLSGSFEAGTGTSSIVELNGSASQTVSGAAGFSNSNSFNRLTINNPAGVVFTLDAEVKDVLNLADGRVIVDGTTQFSVDNYSPDAITGASATRYVDGPLFKRINYGASFDFPLGNESRYGNILITNVTAEGMWRAQYHSSSPSGAGLSTSSKEAPVQYVSSGEYWNIEAPVAATADVTLRWDASSGVNPAESGLRGVQWLTDKWHEVTLSNVSGTSSFGTARIPSLTFNANPGEGNYLTFGAITIPAYTWTGATDTDWFKPGNWTDSTVPSASANTTIALTGNMPVIAGANVAQVNNLIIDAGVDLTVASNGKLTVNGDLNIAATGELVLDNAYGLNGMSSLITHGQILGTGSTRIRLTTPSNQWFYLGSSIKDAVFSDFSAGEPDIIINIYRANKWWGIKSGLAHRSLRSMEGIVTNLLLDGAPDRLIEYTGELHTAAVSRLYDESGYHLLANPYPSFISWEEAAGWDRPNVSGTIWYRGKIGEEMAFITYNRDALPNAKVALYPDTEVTFTTEEELALIPPMQAVWVSTAVPGVTVTVKPEARRHGIDGSRLKSSSSSRYGDVIRIETGNEFSRDGAVLYFSNDSEEALDKGDSEKYFNDSENIPEIYTRVGEKALSINGLPLLNEAARTIPLSVRNRIAGEVTMKFDLSYYYGQHTPYLEDKETGTFINLLHENSYTYTVSETGDNHDRFVLNFYLVSTNLETPGADETDAGSDINIKSLAGKVLVSVGMDLLKDGNGTVEIYTIEGRKISTLPARSSRTLILLPDESGVYIIRAKFGNQVKSGRVIGGM
jgi:hypothetical protein